MQKSRLLRNHGEGVIPNNLKKIENNKVFDEKFNWY